MQARQIKPEATEEHLDLSRLKSV